MGWRSGLRKNLVKALISGACFLISGQVQGQRPAFKKKKIHVGSIELTAEIADSEEKITHGLMYRKQPMKDSEGMLFIFNSEKKLTFWMKNTFIPLSIGFFSQNKKLAHTAEMEPVRSEMEKPKTYDSQVPAMYVLEVAPGWFSRNKIALGALLYP